MSLLGGGGEGGRLYFELAVHADWLKPGRSKGNVSLSHNSSSVKEQTAEPRSAVFSQERLLARTTGTKSMSNDN